MTQMNTSQQLAQRFREVILNGTWIANTNYKDQLEDLDWKIVVFKSDSKNSIAALAQHIHYYINGIKQVFEGGYLEIRDKFSFHFPEINSETEWKAFLNRFWQDTESFAKLLEQCPAEKWSENFVDEKYGSFQRNIDGLIEHSYYHLGQIVLLKKSTAVFIND